MSLRNLIFEQAKKTVENCNVNNIGFACFKPEGEFYCISLDEHFDSLCRYRSSCLLTQYKSNVEKSIDGENIFLRIGVPGKEKDELNYWLYEKGMWNICSLFLPLKNKVYGIFFSGGYDSVQHIENCINKKEDLIQCLKNIDSLIKSEIKDEFSFSESFKFNIPYQKNLLESLSEREKQVITNISLGMTQKEISNKLSLSENTIKEYLKRSKDKLNGLNVRSSLLSDKKLFVDYKKYII